LLDSKCIVIGSFRAVLTFLLLNGVITLSKNRQDLSELSSSHILPDMSGDAPAKLMDVVFLIDATGSMAATLKGAHDKAAEIAIDLRVRNPAVKFEFGCVCYRDPVDCQGDVHEVHQLSDNMDSLVDFLATVRAQGGGDGPEDWVGAYDLALGRMAWRGGAKTIVHIADAPAHGARFCGSRNHEEESSKLDPLIKCVAQRGILVMGLDLNGGSTLSFNACKAIYDAAGGRKYTIESFVVQGGWGEDAGRCTRSCAMSSSMGKRMRCCRRSSTREDDLSSWVGKKRKCRRRSSGSEDDLSDAALPPASDGIGAKLATATASVCEDALAMEYA
jgi:hypothetical protein